MYKVTIDNAFFNLDPGISTGLISGLKLLSRKNFSIFVEDIKLDSNDPLQKILQMENIKLFGKKTRADFSKEFNITSKNINNAESTAIIICVDEGGKVNTFEKAVNEILIRLRSSVLQRDTKETKIKVAVSLDGEGTNEIKTGVGFFDHMLEQIARHGNINLTVLVDGDLFVDEHHTVEDTGITLGAALSDALGDKRGIKRYGFYLPMDESIARCALDLGGRAYLNFKCKFNREKVGDFPTELTEEFFRGVASGLKANIFLRAKGKNDHHKIEGMFKAFAKALNEACRIDERSRNVLPTTKGVL